VTIPLNDLLVNLKWNEEGAEIPARVRAQLAQLATAQAALARQAGLGAAPGAGPGAPLRAGAGRSPFQAEWASSSQILQAMQRDAAKARGAITDLKGGLEDVQPAAAGANRHLGTLRMAASTAAFQIIGMGGMVGRLSSGLLLFAAGSGPALAAVLAIGALGLAFRDATRDARMNREENEKLVVSLKAIGTHATITANRIEIQRLEALRDEPSLGRRLVRGALGIMREGPLQGVQNQRVVDVEELEREIARLRGEIGAAGEDLTQPGREALRSANFAREAARLRQQLFSTGGPVTALDVTERLRAQALRQDPNISAEQAQTIARRERETAAINASTEAHQKLREAMEDAAIRLDMVGAAPQAVTEALRARALERAGMAPDAAAGLAARERHPAPCRRGQRSRCPPAPGAEPRVRAADADHADAGDPPGRRRRDRRARLCEHGPERDDRHRGHGGRGAARLGGVRAARVEQRLRTLR